MIWFGRIIGICLKTMFCYYFGEYTARKPYSYSATNQLIGNFKKKVDRRGRPDWHYKEEAIRQVAAVFRAAIADKSLDAMTFIPIPPSKAKTDQLYDDRLVKMLRAIRSNPVVDVREIITQTNSTMAAHESDQRPTPDQLEQIYAIDRALLKPVPGFIAVVDDVLTTGCHFVAMKRVLARTFPEAKIIGLFLARRVPETADPDDFDDVF